MVGPFVQQAMNGGVVSDTCGALDMFLLCYCTLHKGADTRRKVDY